MKDYESLERVKFICDEKEKQFQELAHKGLGDSVSPEVRYLHRIIWRMFFDFQLELLKAEAEEVCGRDPLIHDQFMGKFPPKPEPMEAAAIDAGYIKDMRDKPNEKGDYPVPIVAGELWRYVGDGSDFFTISKTYLVMNFNEIGEVVLIDDHGSRHPWSKMAFLNDFVRVQLS